LNNVRQNKHANTFEIQNIYLKKNIKAFM